MISPCMFCNGEIRQGESIVKIYDSRNGFDVGHWPCTKMLSFPINPIYARNLLRREEKLANPV